MEHDVRAIARTTRGDTRRCIARIIARMVRALHDVFVAFGIVVATAAAAVAAAAEDRIREPSTQSLYERYVYPPMHENYVPAAALEKAAAGWDLHPQLQLLSPSHLVEIR